MANILIIDDDQKICDAMGGVMNRLGHKADSANTLQEGISKNSSIDFDVVFLDVQLPDGNGLDALPKIQRSISNPEVIIITGNGDPDGAELAIKSGAWDYIEKPLSIEGMTLPLIRALQYRNEKKTKRQSVTLIREGIIGNGPDMMHCLDLLAQAANSEAGVIITGETGTGKDLFANAVHQNSGRKSKNFVVVDCAALPGTLVESLLFGHEKGAFTGADKPHVGLVKQADGGTLFLDEVGELPLAVQKAFLRVLDERRFRPVGGKKELKSDFRLVAATNRDLYKMVQEGKFRRDLLFRIQTIVIHLPPLRERIEDVKEIAMYYMAKLCERHGMVSKGISPEFMESLMAYEWPGNVRELANTIENILTTSGEDPILFPKHLPTQIRVAVKRASMKGRGRHKDASKTGDEPFHSLGTFADFRQATLMEAEKNYLENLMIQARQNIKEARSVSGLSRPRLYALLKKHKISRKI